MTSIALLQKHVITNEKFLKQMNQSFTDIYQRTHKFTIEAEFSVASYFRCVEAKNSFALAIWASC